MGKDDEKGENFSSFGKRERSSERRDGSVTREKYPSSLRGEDYFGGRGGGLVNGLAKSGALSLP